MVVKTQGSQTIKNTISENIIFYHAFVNKYFFILLSILRIMLKLYYTHGPDDTWWTFISKI
ncbi:hypothetical protein GvMRE_I1g165 [endosymbiont GvMRE of Glomus versiforme]|nr:hypothetical protein GvMRE_I1g165 [endosymbiont GvMRE of Glomus versiforme]